MPGTGCQSALDEQQPRAQRPARGYLLAHGRLTDTDSIAVPEGVELRVVAQEPIPCFGYYWATAGHILARY
jgi:hypothetical protein